MAPARGLVSSGGFNRRVGTVEVRSSSLLVPAISFFSVRCPARSLRPQSSFYDHTGEGDSGRQPSSQKNARPTSLVRGMNWRATPG